MWYVCRAKGKQGGACKAASVNGFLALVASGQVRRIRREDSNVALKCLIPTKHFGKRIVVAHGRTSTAGRSRSSGPGLWPGHRVGAWGMNGHQVCVPSCSSGYASYLLPYKRALGASLSDLAQLLALLNFQHAGRALARVTNGISSKRSREEGVPVRSRAEAYHLQGQHSRLAENASGARGGPGSAYCSC